jgi:hypothetical protein
MVDPKRSLFRRDINMNGYNITNAKKIHASILETGNIHIEENSISPIDKENGEIRVESSLYVRDNTNLCGAVYIGGEVTFGEDAVLNISLPIEKVEVKEKFKITSEDLLYIGDETLVEWFNRMFDSRIKVVTNKDDIKDDGIIYLYKGEEVV